QTPATIDVATFVGTPRINVFPVALADASNLRMADQLVSGLSIDQRRPPAHAAIRPEHIVLAEPGPDALIGSIRQIEFLGSEGLMHVDLAQSGASETTLKAIVKADAASLGGIEKGRIVGLRCAWAHLHLFDVQGARLDLDAQLRPAATES